MEFLCIYNTFEIPVLEITVGHFLLVLVGQNIQSEN